MVVLPWSIETSADTGMMSICKGGVWVAAPAKRGFYTLSLLSPLKAEECFLFTALVAAYGQRKKVILSLKDVSHHYKRMSLKGNCKGVFTTS